MSFTAGVSKTFFIVHFQMALPDEARYLIFLNSILMGKDGIDTHGFFGAILQWQYDSLMNCLFAQIALDRMQQDASPWDNAGYEAF